MVVTSNQMILGNPKPVGISTGEQGNTQIKVGNFLQQVGNLKKKKKLQTLVTNLKKGWDTKLGNLTG